jgi:lysophospholipase L1-like esterase
MLRVAKYGLSTILLVALVVGAYFVGRAHAPGPSVPLSVGTNTFYLDMGGSSSLGTQPTGVATRNGHRTNLGYANDLKEIEARRGVALDLHQIGCPGETVQSMLDTVGGDRCNTPPVTQLSRARKFLLSHHDQPGVVTIDLGFNNIRPCLSHATVHEACFEQQLVLINKDLPIILHDLTDVAGPRVRFVGFEYEDPFLARYLDGPTGPAVATATLTDVDTFNAALKKAYDAASIPIANLPATFKNDDNTPVVINNVGTIPENVAVICDLTWMCQPAPFGPDDHPNNEGYRSIAVAIADNLPKSW